LRVTTDIDDNLVLECALEARADYLVTGISAIFLTSFKTFALSRQNNS
jgi:predicted nucleic acid-binding protein